MSRPWSPLASIALTLAVACNASSSGGTSSPNVTPGQCVLSDGIWYCGTGYGNFPDCPIEPPQAICAPDAGACFSCSQGAGNYCTCVTGEDGGRSGACSPTETGCMQPQ